MNPELFENIYAIKTITIVFITDNKKLVSIVLLVLADTRKNGYNQSINQSINQLVGRSVGPSVNQSIKKTERKERLKLTLNRGFPHSYQQNQI